MSEQSQISMRIICDTKHDVSLHNSLSICFHDVHIIKHNCLVSLWVLNSVKFANIYMHVSKFVNAYNGYIPNFIARLIDDCFFMWTRGVDEHDNFLNDCHDFKIHYRLPRVLFRRGITVSNLLTSTECHPTTEYSYRDTIDVLKALEFENTCHYVKPCDKPLR